MPRYALPSKDPVTALYLSIQQQVFQAGNMVAASMAYSATQLGLAELAWRGQRTNYGFRRLTESQQKINIQNNVKYAVSISGREIIASAIAKSDEGTAGTLRAVSKVYERGLRVRESRALTLNKLVAQEAIAATVARYDNEKRKRDRNTFASEAYRPGGGNKARYGGGQLRAALASPLMAQATKDGVIFLNQSLLDQQAKQWARLNFGAGAAAGSGVGFSRNERPTLTRGYNANFFGMNQGSVGAPVRISLRDTWRPSPAFQIPVGRWFAGSNMVAPNPSQRGQHQFYPISSIQASKLGGLNQKYPSQNRQTFARLGFQRRKTTRGIAAWNFLDAGMQSIAANFPAAMSLWLTEIFNEPVGTGLVGKQNITPKTSAAAIARLEAQSRQFLSATGSRGTYRAGLVGRLNF